MAGAAQTDTEEATTPSRGFPWLLLFGAASLTIFVALGRLDGVLRGMHPPGSPAYGVTDLTTVFPPWDLDRPLAAVAAWTEGETPGFTSAGTVVAAFFALDFAFTIAFGLALGISARRLAKATDGDVTRLGWLCVGATMLYVASDIAEGILGLLTLGSAHLWASDPENGHAAWTGGAFAVATWFKWFFLAVALTGLAMLLVSYAQSRRDDMSNLRRGWRRLVVLRGQAVLAIVFAVALLVVPITVEQSGDVLRGWADARLDAAIGVASVAVFSLTLFGGGWALLGRAEHTTVDTSGFWDRGPRLFQALEIVALGAGAALVVAGWVWDVKADDGRGLIVLGAILIVPAVLAPFVPDSSKQTWQAKRDEPAIAMAALIAAVPLVALGLALMAAGISEAAFASTSFDWASFPADAAVIGGGIVLQACGWMLYLGRRGAHELLDGHPAAREATAYGAAALAIAAALTLALSPNAFGPDIGAVGVLGMFAFVAAVIAYGLGWLADRLPPGRTFAALNMTRFPVIALLVIWLAVASAVDRDGRRYDVETASSAQARNATAQALGRPALNGRLPVEDSTKEPIGAGFDAWVEAQRPAANDSGRPRPLPMLFVAAAGGGARAAYWTALIMDCVVMGRPDDTTQCPRRLPPERTRIASSVFLASGASGGSLGLTGYTAHLISEARLVADGVGSTETSEDWVDASLGGDFLAPVLAAGLFRDLPLAFIRSDDVPNRADALERAWESRWGTTTNPMRAGLLELERWRGVVPIPLLVLNGTTVQEGCRFNASALDLGVEQQSLAPTNRRAALVDECLGVRDLQAEPQSPAAEKWALRSTEDLRDVLCDDEDVRLSTAALLSARFPFVSPSGRLRPERCRPSVPQVNVVDGGIFDNSAGGTVAEVWRAVSDDVAKQNAKHVASPQTEPCVVPLFLEIDNHFADPTPPSAGGRPGELTAPLDAVLATAGSREASSRQEAALAFTGPFGPIEKTSFASSDGSAIVRVVSVFPRAHPGQEPPLGWSLSDDAGRQLREQLDDNDRALARVRAWLDQELVCTPARRS